MHAPPLTRAALKVPVMGCGAPCSVELNTVARTVPFLGPGVQSAAAYTFFALVNCQVMSAYVLL